VRAANPTLKWALRGVAQRDPDQDANSAA